MAERVDSRTWTMRAVYIALAFVLIVVQLVPLDMRPAGWAGPDLLLAVTLVWIARRPVVVTAPMVAGVFLMADLFFMRPPGLWAALVVILTEMIRRRNSEFRNLPFVAEWGTIAGGIIMMTLLNLIILTLLAVPRASLGLTLMEMMMTILVYPPIVLLAYFFFGIGRPAPGETGRKGQLL